MAAIEQNAGRPGSRVGALLADSTLERAAKAVLLLRLCRLAHFACPSAAGRYWAALAPLQSQVPADYQEELTAIRALLEPPLPSARRGFAGEIIEEVSAAAELIGTDPDQARQRFEACEQRLNARRWPFGKKPAWNALAGAWAPLDRQRAIGLMRQLRAADARRVVLSLDRQARLTADQWDAAHESARGGAVPAICEVLDADKPALTLSRPLFSRVADALLAEMRQKPVTEADAQRVEAKREKALERYLRLVVCAEQAFPGDVALMESLVVQTATTAPFEKWPDRFAALRRLLIIWAEWPTHRESARAVLDTKLPAHLRDFALTEWHALMPATEAEARVHWTTLREACKDPVTAEVWFLVTLLRRGLPAIAFAMAEESAQRSDLVPRLRRAWLVLDPQAASTGISKADLGADRIAHFLHLSTVAERVAWLREQSEAGRSVPEDFWGRLTFEDLVRDAVAEKHLLSLYTKTEAADKQFQSYVRLHAFAHHSYDALDPFLLETLVAWDDEHPQEVETFLGKLWSTVEPDTDLLRADVLRNAIFERCQKVFSARPESLNDLFVKWVKREAVDKVIRQQVGNTIYTFGLKPTVPFIYCLLGAQHVARHSATRCHQLITIAVRDYTATPELMISAARLYAADQRLNALEPPATLKDAGHRGAWQIGVLQASTADMVEHLAGESAEPQPA